MNTFFEERNNFTFYGAVIIGISLLLAAIYASAAPNFRVERTIIPEANNTYQIGSSTNPTRIWLNGYFKNASSSVLSVHDRIYLGGTATSTLFGTATSTFLSGIELDALYAIRGLSIGGTATTTILGSATSTFPSGIFLSGGGLRIDLNACSGSNALNVNAAGGVICGAVTAALNPPDLIYRTLGTTKYYTASTSATDNLAFHFNNGFVSSASSTIAGTLNIQGGALTLGTALGATNGGTGQSTWATGDILYSGATDSLSKLTVGTRGTVLSVTTSGIPGWVSTSTLVWENDNATSTLVSGLSAGGGGLASSQGLVVSGGSVLISSGRVGLGTTTPNDNATTSAASVFYAGGAIRNQMCNLTDATTIFVDGNCGNRFRVQMAGNRIIEFHHFYESQTGIITLQQDATGSRIPTKWIAVNPAGTRRGVVWRGGATTTLSTAGNRIDKIGFEMGTDTLFMIASSTNFIPIDY